MNAEIQKLLGEMRSADIDVRRKAAHTISEMGVDAACAVDDIYRLIACGREGHFLSYNFGKLGPATRAYASQLMDALESRKELRIFDSAAIALESMGENAEPVFDRVLKFLDRDWKDNYWPWKDLIKILRNIDPRRQRDHDHITFKLCKIFKKLYETTECSKDLRYSIGDLGYYAVPAVVECLKSEPHFFMRILCYMGPEAREAYPDVLELARKRSAYALSALSSIGIYNNDVEEILKSELMERGDDSRLLDAVGAAGWFGPIASPVVPELIEILEDENFQFRSAVPGNIGCIGPRAHLAIPALAKSLEWQNEAEQRSTAHALWRMGPEAISANALIHSILSREFSPQYIFENRGDSKRPRKIRKIAAIADVVRNVYERGGIPHDYGKSAILALRNIGHAAAEAAPVLVEVLDCPIGDAFSSAMDALVSIGPSSLSALLPALKNKESTVRMRALWVGGRISTPNPMYVDSVVSCLEDHDGLVRWFAVWNLKQLKIKDAVVKARFRKLSAEDSDAEVRKIALEAC